MMEPWNDLPICEHCKTPTVTGYACLACGRAHLSSSAVDHVKQAAAEAAWERKEQQTENGSAWQRSRPRWYSRRTPWLPGIQQRVETIHSQTMNILSSMRVPIGRAIAASFAVCAGGELRLIDGHPVVVTRTKHAAELCRSAGMTGLTICNQPAWMVR